MGILTGPDKVRNSSLRKGRLRAVNNRVASLRAASEAGSATAEYAIATMAAVGFAGLLVVIMRSDEVRGLLTELVRNALTYGG